MNDTDYDDDQEDDILIQKLPVAQFDTFDPKQMPADGEEYLRRVQLEAQKCPKIVVAALDTSSFKINQTMIIPSTNGFIQVPAEFRPTAEWQRWQISQFSHLRMKIEKLMKEEKFGRNLNMPPKRNISWWRKHCLGKLADEDSSSSESGQSSVIGTPQSSNSNKSDCLMRGQKPLLSTLCCLSQLEIYRVISYHIKWIKQYGFTHQNGLWLYSLLVCLEKPFTSEVDSMLRELSREISLIRSKFISSNEKLSNPLIISLNLIICIIGRYFNQSDMIDD